MKILYSIKEATSATGFGKDRLYRALKSGELEAKRIGGRTMILADSLNRWIAEKPAYEPRDLAINAQRKKAKRAVAA